MKKIICIISVVTLLAACKSATTEVAEKGYYYTCSMHPQVHENHPGLCPICHMELIKVKVTQTSPDEISLNEDQVRLGNIIVDTISFSNIGDKQILTATINADEGKTDAIAARMSGRIDRLFFKTVGEYVTKGQPVFSIYSEELNNAKQELINLVQKRKALNNDIINFDNLIEASKQKLMLLGMTAGQITAFIQSGHSPDNTTFYSPVSGYITELPLMEGDYVPEGGTVVRIADLSHLWAETQVYVSQMSRMPDGAVVDLEFPDLPGKKVSGRVSFVTPELMNDSRIVLMRVPLDNKDGKLRPGMPAYVIAKTGVENALTLPVDAVIRDGKMNMVWIKTDSSNYKWKMVQTGNESNHRIAITSGLNEGDKVVVSGAYLLNSEYLLKKGGGDMGMGGMNMDGMDMGGHQH